MHLQIQIGLHTNSESCEYFTVFMWSATSMLLSWPFLFFKQRTRFASGHSLHSVEHTHNFKEAM